MQRISLIEDLTFEPVPAGSTFLIEFDSASQWYNASFTITAGWLKQGGKVDYWIAAQPPEKMRSQLRKLGISNVEELGKRETRDLGLLHMPIWFASLSIRTKTRFEPRAVFYGCLST
jgi:hypothetical protein